MRITRMRSFKPINVTKIFIWDISLELSMERRQYIAFILYTKDKVKNKSQT